MSGSRPRAIAFLGLGLIGGSIARAVVATSGTSDANMRPHLTAWTPDGRGPVRALEAGVIDVAAGDPAAAIQGADLVVLAAPPLATIELVRRLGSDLREALAADAVVTDVASTKGMIMAAADAAGLRFVGGHPMAGRETSGFEASTADLVRDRPWVVVGGTAGDREIAAPVRWLIGACGARAIELDADTHDAAVAAISHLPLIASAALVEAVAGDAGPEWPLLRALAASGWEGMTRLARGDARMGAGIAATNAPALVACLQAYRAAIDGWIAELEPGDPDPAALERRLAAARALLARDPDPA
ncbi:MAG: prephenate dehydrogenase/arogenate dehydrogenase family protein [Chloroflexi bacterium]|nr:prephenate dehydrogenase/arogenate dehydrogenase family protein [Chloroflexota bacterium]